ncbi:MAG TPA: carbohydrate-binding family 9-like protein, partial [Pyrinomonadaceae bacterium]|nr:carbohydrate-binding family 9-like protein [Pyrinomonadaceae bacterium]
YWSGETAPAGRHSTVRLLWSDDALHVRFDAAQAEPFVISDSPDRTAKTPGLWDRDVCEIFIAPNSGEPRKYYEFEVAPTGEWVDLFVDNSGPERKTDTDYSSGMMTAAGVFPGKVVMAMRIDFSALGGPPEAGERWLGNLYRCVGRDPGRGYLAYNPTETPEPNFHVPEKFVEFEFKS